jgi:hypothetical protein
MVFGYGKEVLIANKPDGYNFRAYLCGRIDQPIDDGKIIAPMDFKTHSYFDGTEKDMFKPHDGIQGYTFGLNEMLPEEYKAKGRSCYHAIIRHISVRYDKDERFKSSEIAYTPGEMAAWLKRQQATFKQIYRVISDLEDITWDTDVCDSWFFSKKCPYKPLHECSTGGREGIIKTFYKIVEPWSHENNGQ